MTLKLTIHARQRLTERVGITPDDFAKIFDENKYLDIKEKHSCQHCLFYSVKTNEFFTAIIEWRVGKVVTITPSGDWVSDAIKRAAKQLIKYGEKA